MDQSFGLVGLRSLPTEIPCCGRLASTLGSKLSFPGNATYVATQQSYWSLQEASLSPACILTPETPQDVSEAISIISGIESCHLAVKGQSHAPAAGFANIDGGVTIDMTKLKSVAVNTDHTVAIVGGGASWLDVYLYLDTFGLTVAGGRNGAVGVGGLTLGGGISYFTPRVGFTCDTVVNFEIVLASGRLVNANATARPDLFRALKGGGNNFGVVTRFDFATVSQGPISDGNFVQTISNREAVFQAFAKIAGAREYDPYASIVTSIVFNATSKAWITSSAAIYTKPILNPPVYQELRAIPNIVNNSKITNLSTLAAEKPTPPLNWLFYTSTYGVSAPLLNKFFDACNSTLYGFNVPGGVVWSISFEPLPTVATKYGNLKGGNSLGTSPKDGNGVVLLLAALWPHTASNALVQSTAQTLLTRINEIATSMNLLHRFQYLNYADPSQHPLGSYGEETVERLSAVSRKYDPRGVFQVQVPGGFKLVSRY